MGINCIFNENKEFAARFMLHADSRGVVICDAATKMRATAVNVTDDTFCVAPEVGPGLTFWSASHCCLWLSDMIPTEHGKLRDLTLHNRSRYANDMRPHAAQPSHTVTLGGKLVVYSLRG